MWHHGGWSAVEGKTISAYLWLESTEQKKTNYRAEGLINQHKQQQAFGCVNVWECVHCQAQGNRWRRPRTPSWEGKVVVREISLSRLWPFRKRGFFN